MFGENLTTAGLLEDAVHIGDEFRVGTARLIVTQPRLPCYKLGLRFDDPRMVKTFVQAGKPGIYFAVLEEGVVGPGDPIERIAEDASRITVAEMFRLVLDQDAAGGVNAVARRAGTGGRLEKGTGRASWGLMPRGLDHPHRSTSAWPSGSRPTAN